VIIKSDEISHRVDFSLLCKARGIDKAYEIGTDRGLFADDLLSRWPECRRLVCVDPYEPYDEMPWSRQADLLMATQRLAQYRDRVKFWQTTSDTAAMEIEVRTEPCLVYIDGDHNYSSVLDDIKAWHKFAPKGSIIAGHDYDYRTEGVMQAVNEFFRSEDDNYFVRLTHEQDEPPSWYVYKGGEPKTLMRRLFIKDEIPNERYRKEAK